MKKLLLCALALSISGQMWAAQRDIIPRHMAPMKNTSTVEPDDTMVTVENASQQNITVEQAVFIASPVKRTSLRYIPIKPGQKMQMFCDKQQGGLRGTRCAWFESKNVKGMRVINGNITIKEKNGKLVAE